MGSGDTTRYVDDVLELVGVKGKSHERLARAFSVPDIEVYSMAEQIRDRTRQHHRESWARVRGDVLEEKQPKAFHFYSPKTVYFLTAGTDRFLRRAALYFNKIVIENPLSTLTMEGLTPYGLRSLLRNCVDVLRCVEPWVAEGVVELAPNYQQVESIAGLVDRCEEIDSADLDWQKRVTDLLSPGELEQTIQRMATPEALSLLGKGNAKDAVPRIFSRASSMKIAWGYFGSMLTGCIPITDSAENFKLFQFWISQRLSSDMSGKGADDAFMREAKAGRAWLALDARELLVLDTLDPSKIIEIRKSSEHSFQSFRNDLGRAVDEITGLNIEDEVAYREAAERAWQRVRESANSVKKDLPKIERKLKIDGLATAVVFSLTLGLAPVVPLAALTSGMTAVAPLRDLAKTMIDYQEIKKCSGYFLLNLEEAKKPLQHM
jgi:hypothetical protein